MKLAEIASIPCAPTKYRCRIAEHEHSAQQKGFNLIELMIVVTIIALLATVALPSYQDYVDRADIALARADIEGIEQTILRFEVSNQRLPSDSTELGIDGLLDPWGNQYEYFNHAGARGNGKFRKFKGEVPLNSDYDLYSAGKDGKSVGPLTAESSRDDIVRAANGAFIGLGADYDNANFSNFGNNK